MLSAMHSGASEPSEARATSVTCNLTATTPSIRDGHPLQAATMATFQQLLAAQAAKANRRRRALHLLTAAPATSMEMAEPFRASRAAPAGPTRRLPMLRTAIIAFGASTA